MNQVLFKGACTKVIGEKAPSKGIGTLGEKTLHAVLKHYLEIDETKHETKVGAYVADILTDEGIIEIQTRQFDKLRRKLDTFLLTYSVTVVYPIPYCKWLIWMDPKSSVVTKKRKSPKTGGPWEIFHELSKIKKQLNNPNLHFHIIMLNIEEYRLLNGWSQDHKRGSSRFDRIPIDIAYEVHIDNVSDYRKLLPVGLPQSFTAKDFQRLTRLSISKSQSALLLLFQMDIVKRIDKKGNAYIYELIA